MHLNPADVRRSLERLRPHLSPTEHGRITMIIAALDPAAGRAPMAPLLAAIFPDAEREAQNKALTRLRDRIAEAATEAGLRFALVTTSAKAGGATAREVWFEGDALLLADHTTPELDRAGDRLVPDTRALPITEPRVRLTERQDGKPVVRWFFSYAHADGKLAEQLYKELELRLKNSRDYTFLPWRDTRILVGEDWDAQIKGAMAESHIGVLAVSHNLLASTYIKKNELPSFVRGDGAGVEGRRVVPVALEQLDLKTIDLKGLGERQIWHDEERRSFEKCTGPRRKAWVDGLVQQIVQLIQKYADGPDTPPPSGAPVRPASLLSSCPPARHAHTTSDLEKIEAHIEEPVAMPATLSQRDLTGAAKEDAQAVPALAYLLDWLAEPAAPPVFALLGEYGMGKTVTCQRLVRELEARRARGEALPTPLYFDLRSLTGLRDRPTPKLTEIIDECISRGWEPPVDAPHPTALELIKRARAEPFLFVFDGLDEALVHLTEVDGQAFTREILKLRPPLGSGAPTRLLLSCRTHYFRTLQDQHSHFTGNDRGSTEPEHYRAMVLLPLGEEQIRGYFARALPGMDVDRTLELVQSVHNLSELARRPYTLRLVTELLPEIEQLRARGRPVYGVTLYRAMVNRWMSRDNGKHHLQPDHKLRLMTHLAAWMWARGQRVIAASELEPWFHAWLNGQPDLLRYRSFSVDKLEEDLRTATFLVREDDGEGGGGFRFAHSSMAEFFLSRHLVESLRAGRREAWAMPCVSPETRDFFAQHLQEAADPTLLARLGAWRAPYLAGASEQWLAYVVDAAARGWPRPTTAGADLSGADLQGWTLAGTTDAPLDLSGSRWAGANLRETRWRDLRLDRADLSGADLRRAELQDVDCSGARLCGAAVDGATFRRAALEGVDWSGASVHQVWFPLSRPVSASRPATTYTLAAGSGHSSVVSACAFSPDGATAISASYDQALCLWDARSGRCLATWTGHTNGVIACTFSPDGDTAISASDDHTLRLWDARSGRCLATWTGHTDWVIACAFSPDGATAISASYDRTLRLWDTRSETCLATWTGHTGPVNACAFSSDGATAISASDDHTLRIWDARSGACLATWTGHTSRVTACAFSPDGATVLSASSDDTLRLWDARSGRCLATWTGHSNGVTACAFAPDGAAAISASDDRTLRIWDTRSGTCLATWTGHTGQVTACAFSPDGATAISASFDHTLRLWDTRSGACLATWTGHTGQVTACAFSPDGDTIISTTDDHTLRLWDARSGVCLATWTGHANGVTACAFSPDGATAISASYDRTLRLWDTRSETCLATWTGHTGPVNACAFSSDGATAISASDDHTLRLWDTHSGTCLATWTGHTGPVYACAFSPDGDTVISASYDRTLRLWDTHSGTCLATWTGHAGTVTACAFSPDGATAISASDDHTLRRWDTRSGACLATWTGHTGTVNACAFSPDGATAISASYDNTLRVWDTRSGRCLRVHQQAKGEHAVWIPATERSREQIVEASDGAWRWLAWQERDSDGNIVDLLPVEAFGPLPAPIPRA